MSTTYAKGRYAYGFCDRCSFRYDLGDLKFEYTRGIKTGLRVCEECFDIDHPQNFLGRDPIYDPQALRDARPDTNLTDFRAFFGFDPVTGVETLTKVGTVTILTP